MTNPFENSPAAALIRERVRDLKPKKSQKAIATEAGFVNANVVSILKSGTSKIPLDRVPALARALEVDPAHLMRLAIEQAIGATAAAAVIDCLGAPVTRHELAWIAEIRDASDSTDPRLTARARISLRGIFGK
jgi:hypothetical protein